MPKVHLKMPRASTAFCPLGRKGHQDLQTAFSGLRTAFKVECLLKKDNLSDEENLPSIPVLNPLTNESAMN